MKVLFRLLLLTFSAVNYVDAYLAEWGIFPKKKAGVVDKKISACEKKKQNRKALQ